MDRQLKKLVEDMFAIMYEHRGVGLAANQVDWPVQLFVVNLEADPDKGEELVFINPVIQSPKGNEEAEEGCLSLPGLYGSVVRPAQVRVTAYDLSGTAIDRTVDGWLARVIQHEFDHLQGVLFPDRMTEAARRASEADLEGFELEFKNLREQGKIPSDQVIAKRLEELEDHYCR